MLSESIIFEAKQSIELQSKSISNLVDRIGDSFVKATNLLLETKGRVIVSGIGKSAIIAEKIVATFNSTGTPSIFMHAADAIHGDLGMVQKEDLVVLISKSGETSEIKYLLPIIRSYGNPVIAIVGNCNSYLAQYSDVFLDTTVEKEACPNNLAPTTSTTAQLVIGDALAVVLMKARSFKAEDFAKYHPGGNLGKRLLLRVEDLYINNSKPFVYLDTPIVEVILEISRNRLGITAVVNDKHELLGVITDGDLRRMIEKTLDFTTFTAQDIYSKNPVIIAPSLFATEALQIFKSKDVNQIIVTNEHEYVGVLHLQDLIREGIF